jgi:hypothetical protein
MREASSTGPQIRKEGVLLEDFGERYLFQLKTSTHYKWRNHANLDIQLQGLLKNSMRSLVRPP